MSQEDRTRLEEFRQFRREVRGSKEYLLVGIDVAKDKHYAFFGTATGKTLFRRLVFENSIEGFRKLLVQAEAMKAQGGLTKVVFGMEPTGNYHKPLGEHLIRCGHGVVLVSGVAAHENRKTLDGRWDTNDTRDAANVADLISQGKCLFYEFPGGALQDLRNLLSLKRRFKRVEHGYRVRIRNHLLAKYFPELDRYYEQSESTALAIVRWCLDPSEIAGWEYKKFVQMVSLVRGRSSQEKRLQTIWKMAVDSVGCEAGPTVEFEAQVMVEGLKQIRESIRQIDEKIHEVCCPFPEYECLLSIPGFGRDVSAKVLGAIGDPFRFQNGRQVLKLAGFDLSAERSGKFAAHIGLYGCCDVVYRDDEKVTGKPIRLFHGTADDIELIEPCREYVSRLKKAGADVTLAEYPGVHHGYDWFMFKEPFKLPQARTGHNCSLAEGERGQLLDTKTGKPYDPNVSCTEKGGTLAYNEAATVATTAAVKELLTTTFGLKR